MSSLSKQLTLDLGTPAAATFENFFVGENLEVVTRLRELPKSLRHTPPNDRSFYIWGECGSGRSHLLHAIAYLESDCQIRYLSPMSALHSFHFDLQTHIYLIDDCDQLSNAQQISLFHLFNEVRMQSHYAVIMTGNTAPQNLKIREDLRTRLAWGLVYKLTPISDTEKIRRLQQEANTRGLTLSLDILNYLMTHFRRDMPSLMALLNELDQFSLAQKRSVTLPLLRNLLAQKELSPH